MTPTIKLDVESDGVALITIDVPERKLNVLSPELFEQLGAVIDHITHDSAIKGVVITSGKVGNFIAGADLKEIVHRFDDGLGPQQVALQTAATTGIFRQLEKCGKPVAAAINGSAFGGGYELCLACHYRVLVDDETVRIGLPEVQFGLSPGAGGTQRLPRLIGIERALPLLLSGHRCSAREALAYRLVDALVPAEKLIETARQWVLSHPDAQQPWDRKGFLIPGGAGAMAPHSATSFGIGLAKVRHATQDNYPAPLAILSCVYEGTQLPFDLALKLEANYFATLVTGVVARNVIRTLFIHKGAADKLLHRPAGFAKRTVTRLGVFGAGPMGAGIAHAAALSGIDVVFVDATLEQANKGAAYLKKLVNKSVSAARITAQHAQAALAHISSSDELAQLADCQLVIAAFDGDAIKIEVMTQVAAVLNSAAVLACNSANLSLSDLAKQSPQAEQIIGLNCSPSIERMSLVEVIVGVQTSPATLAATLDFVAQLKKTPIIVKDRSSSYISRIFRTYIDEGMAMLAEGILPALIENAARVAGFAIAPLAAVDEVSIDSQKRELDQSLADGLPRKFDRSHSQAVINRLYQLGRFGRKAGGGFYEFPIEGNPCLWKGLEQLYPPKALQPELHEVQHRLLYLQALEAARCMEEGVLNDAADADLGAVLGVAYPTWTGGTLSLIDSVGIRFFVRRCELFANQYGERYRPSAWLKARAERNQKFYPHAITTSHNYDKGELTA